MTNLGQLQKQISIVSNIKARAENTWVGIII